jgi:unsaturated rhamnogalacturonyl hydrolase
MNVKRAAVRPSLVLEILLLVTSMLATHAATVQAGPRASRRVQIKSLKLNPASVTSGTSSTGTVTLTAAAPAGGATVVLSSNNAASIVGTSVTVAAGETTASFIVNTSSVSATTVATITATYKRTSVSAKLTVNPAAVAPEFSSANDTTFTVGVAGSFTVTATGSPTPALSETGTLPSGLVFNSATGLLSGTPAAGTNGSYAIIFTAQNGVGTAATQIFTLTVNPAMVSTLPTAAQVLTAIETVNNYWIANNTPGNADWTEATYFTGDLAAYDATGQANYLTFAQTWASNHSYKLCGSGCGEGPGGDTTTNPDYQAAGEPYIRLYQLSGTASDIAGITESISGMVNSTEDDEWNEPDYINMSAPSFVALGSINSNTNYYTKMDALYSYAANSVGLFNPTTNLWWENPSYVGTSTIWSRGNGWAFAALVKILSVLPKSDPQYATYLSTFTAMAQALAARQRPGGYWNSDLGGTDFAGPESSGTAFFLYGFAWGINNGILDSATYLPVVENAWNFFTNTAIQPSGLLGYVQPVGSAPGPTTATTTADFGVGAFLLAARQMQLLVQ